jgi:hypothetical protein
MQKKKRKIYLVLQIDDTPLTIGPHIKELGAAVSLI